EGSRRCGTTGQDGESETEETTGGGSGRGIPLVVGGAFSVCGDRLITFCSSQRHLGVEMSRSGLALVVLGASLGMLGSKLGRGDLLLERVEPFLPADFLGFEGRQATFEPRRRAGQHGHESQPCNSLEACHRTGVHAASLTVRPVSWKHIRTAVASVHLDALDLATSPVARSHTGGVLT